MVHAPLTRPDQLMAADSATVALSGAADALTAQLTDPFQMPGWQRAGARMLNSLLGSAQKLAFMRRVVAGSASSAAQLPQTDAHLIARWMVSLYPDRPVDGVILGAPSGAAAHLSSLMGWPFFSQHVLVGRRDRYVVDDTVGYVAQCASTVRDILRRNPDFSALIHHDPLHDRFLVGDIGFIRLKYRRVPAAIREFLQRNSQPGATVLILDCGYPWLQTPLPDVHPEARLQVGGLGDISAETYLSDDPELAAYRQSHGGTAAPWGDPGGEPVWRPESEWGTLPEFRDDAIRIAQELGLNPVVVPYEHPDALTALVFRGFQKLWPEAERVYLDCFTHSCPAFNRYAQAIPLWLPFLGQDSLRLAESLLVEIPQEREILISLHPSFAEPGDLATIADWERVLAGRNVSWLGVDRQRYPADLGAYGNYAPALKTYLDTRNLREYQRTTLEPGDLHTLIATL